MKFFDYYGNIEEIDPSRSREENLERLRQALRVWRKRQGDKARITENYINGALEVFSDPKGYEKFRKDWEEQKAKTAKASPEEEFRQLVYGAAIDGEVTTTEYQMLLGEAKRRRIPKGDAERIIQQTVHAHGVPIGQVETRSSEVPAPEVKPNQFRRKWLAGVAVLGLVVGLVIVAKEPWYEPIAPRPDEVIVQAPELEWTKTFEWEGAMMGEPYVRQTSDGGFVLVGTAVSSDSERAVLIKTAANGDESWTKTFVDRWGDSVEQSADGGYVVCGTTMGEPLTVWLMKTDSAGSPAWDVEFASPDARSAHGVCAKQTADGGYIVLGGEYVGDEWAHRVILIKTDAYGHREWEKILQDSDYNLEGRALLEALDGGYVIAGSKSSHSKFLGGWLMKTDEHGDVMWDKTYGGDSMMFNSICQVSDGSYLAAGKDCTYKPEGSCVADVWLVKADALGNVQWEKTFGGRDDDERCRAIAGASDGGCIVVAYPSGIYRSTWLIKTDASGKKQWEKMLNMSDCVLQGGSVQQTVDGGVIVAGLVILWVEPGAMPYAAFLMKLK